MICSGGRSRKTVVPARQHRVGSVICRWAAIWLMMACLSYLAAIGGVIWDANQTQTGQLEGSPTTRAMRHVGTWRTNYELEDADPSRPFALVEMMLAADDWSESAWYGLGFVNGISSTTKVSTAGLPFRCVYGWRAHCIYHVPNFGESHYTSGLVPLPEFITGTASERAARARNLPDLATSVTAIPVIPLPMALAMNASLGWLLCVIAMCAWKTVRRIFRSPGICDSCGYSLAGLPIPSVCPECGDQGKCSASATPAPTSPPN